MVVGDCHGFPTLLRRSNDDGCFLTVLTSHLMFSVAEVGCGHRDPIEVGVEKGSTASWISTATAPDQSFAGEEEYEAWGSILSWSYCSFMRGIKRWGYCLVTVARWKKIKIGLFLDLLHLMGVEAHFVKVVVMHNFQRNGRVLKGWSRVRVLNPFL